MKQFDDTAHFLLEAEEAHEALPHMHPAQAHENLESVVKLYDTWHLAEPNLGLDTDAPELQQRAKQMRITR